IERVRALVASAPGPVVVRDADGTVVAASPGALESPDALTLYVDESPTAYQELRSGFTAAVSHELRTPLARLLALLESAELPGADRDGLLVDARGEVERMTTLVDEILFLSELESGREVVTLTPARAAPGLRDVADALRALLPRRPCPHLARDRARPRDREARGRIRGRTRRGPRRGRRGPRDPLQLSSLGVDLLEGRRVAGEYGLRQWGEEEWRSVLLS